MEYHGNCNAGYYISHLSEKYTPIVYNVADYHIVHYHLFDAFFLTLREQFFYVSVFIDY